MGTQASNPLQFGSMNWSISRSHSIHYIWGRVLLLGFCSCENQLPQFHSSMLHHVALWVENLENLLTCRLTPGLRHHVLIHEALNVLRLSQITLTDMKNLFKLQV